VHSHGICSALDDGPQRVAGVIVIGEWTARYACHLQAAMRQTNESFAQRLGVSVRAVAAWHDKPDLVPRTDVQQILDTALEQASPATIERFTRLMGAENVHIQRSEATGAQALQVAISIVTRGRDVLLVCRRSDDPSDISWQFPAGVIKPGASPDVVAVRETLAETGIHCSVTRHLGSRIHPVTGVLCEYMLCEYLTGEARNSDVLENIDVAWVAVDTLAKFIPADRIYAPVLEALEGQHDGNNP
jgi:8-oxo-dGTP diphosphatase